MKSMKTYVKPSMKTLKLKQQPALLSVSDFGGVYNSPDNKLKPMDDPGNL